MNIYCCGCEKEISARLTYGHETYPHRKDLYSLPFWKCDSCNNFVGCHHKTKQGTKPLGCIPTPEIKNARQHIHKILDPLWQNVKRKNAARDRIYKQLSKELGWKYHTAELRSLEEARKVYRAVLNIKQTALGEQ